MAINRAGMRRHAVCSYVDMPTTRITDAKRNARSVARRRAAIALAIGAAIGVIACAGSDLDPDAPALLTIEECREVGGAPLFDPADERPRASSCPEGLGFLGVFEEPFFGSDGGICCGGLDSREAAETEEPAEPPAAGEAAAARSADWVDPAPLSATEAAAEPAGAAYPLDTPEPGAAAESDDTTEPEVAAHADVTPPPDGIGEADAGASPRK